MMPPAHAEHTSNDVIDVACCDVILIHAGQQHDITAAVMRLCHDIGHKPDTEAAAEKELQFSLQRVMAPAGALDDVVLTELPVRLQVLARRSRFLGQHTCCHHSRMFSTNVEVQIIQTPVTSMRC